MALRLEDFKDRFQGEKCFVIGEGPSLLRTPALPEALVGKLVLGCNQVYGFFLPEVREAIAEGKEILGSVAMPDGSRRFVIDHPAVQRISGKGAAVLPKFLCYSDHNAYVPNKAVIDALPSIKVLGYCKAGIWPYESFPEDSIAVIRSSKRIVEARPGQFDMSPPLTGLTVIMDICLQFAFHLGCTTAYLIGCDCTADGHWYRPERDAKSKWMEKYIQSQWIPNFEATDEVFRRNGRRIWNLSVGGNLDAIERRDIRDILDVEVTDV